MGRVYYNSLGHEAATWKDPRYQDMLLKGIKWVRGLILACGMIQQGRLALISAFVSAVPRGLS